MEKESSALTRVNWWYKLNVTAETIFTEFQLDVVNETLKLVGIYHILP